MQVRFWGTRGSLPASLNTQHIREKIRFALRTAVNKGLGSESDIEAFINSHLPFWVKGTYGTNTPCVEIRAGDDFVLCDAGSGLRDFGNHYMRTHDGGSSPGSFHIFLSHLHWDHIQGFPFFVPAYIKGNCITFYGCHEAMEEALSLQQTSPHFPVRLKDLAAEIRFVSLSPMEAYEVAGFKVRAMEQHHPGKSYGYRFERNGRAVVYSTDSEHKWTNNWDPGPFTEFFRNADLLIFDAQYTFVDACTVKEDWGHSNNLVGVELAKEAGVKHLCLYHMDPLSGDKDLDRFLQDTMKLASLVTDGSLPRISVAWDGMVIELE